MNQKSSMAFLNTSFQSTSRLNTKLARMTDLIFKINVVTKQVILPALNLLILFRTISQLRAQPSIRLNDRTSNSLAIIRQKFLSLNKVKSPTISFKDKISNGLKGIKDKYLKLDTLIKGGKWLFNATLGSAMKQHPDSGASKSWNNIGSGVKNIKENLKNAFTQVGTKNLGKLEDIFKRVQKYVLKLEIFTGGAGFQKFIDAGASALGALLDAAVKVIDYVEPMITPFINTIMAQMPQVKAAIAEVLDWAGPKLLWIADQIPVLQQIWVQAWPTISSVLSTAWSVMKPVLDILFSAIVILWGLFQKAWPHMLAIVEKVWAGLEPIFKSIADMLNLIKDRFGWVAEKLGIQMPGPKESLNKTTGNSFEKQLLNQPGVSTTSNIFGISEKKNDQYPKIPLKSEPGLNKTQTEQTQKGHGDITTAKQANTVVIREEALINRIAKAVTPTTGPINMTFHIHGTNMTPEQVAKVLAPKIKLALTNG